MDLCAAEDRIGVVLFSGGRGSGVLSRELINNPQVHLSLAVNGYDDGASSGEIRRFLGDSLGPSDFRKNAARLARELRSCAEDCIDFLDLRLPRARGELEARELFAALRRPSGAAASAFQKRARRLLGGMESAARREIARALERFRDELEAGGRSFEWSDCSLGNLVFAGCFLGAGRRFNAALGRYCALLHLPEGLIENVTTGTSAYLVALDEEGGLLASEAEIVAGAAASIREIYLLHRPLGAAEQRSLAAAEAEAKERFLADRAAVLQANPALLEKIARADLIVYAPGTQYSSLFPSYLTPGIGAAIARNLTAVKLLITNLQEDAEIPGKSAVDLVERAVYYLREKGARPAPAPLLVTHYLLNDPGRVDEEAPYIPLGRLENLEDPRLVRIGPYEEGLSGRHDARAVLTPFVEQALARRRRRRVAVFLLGTKAPDKIYQTLLEMLRAEIQDLPSSVQVFYCSEYSLAPGFAALLPFATANLHAAGERSALCFARALQELECDYVVLFDSSGIYRGEEIINLASLLNNGRLDAVWGSRRLSLRDVRHSYRRRYGHRRLMGAISYLGSHLLSLACLGLYGRYISDTLSGVRAIRRTYLSAGGIELDDPCLNQRILAVLLRRRAAVFESPVQFFPLRPEKGGHIRVLEGLRALGLLFWGRFVFPGSS